MYMVIKMEKTVAAISTAYGEAGISVIRISGKNSIDIADKVFKGISGKKLSDLKGYSCMFGSVYCGDEKIDECIALVFRQPHSYTGENVVELSCHGGYIITKKVLRTIFECGALPAQPGEFTKRAFLNHKIDLTQAEAVMDLISAKSDFARKTALNIKEGALSKRINGIKDVLVNKAAHLDAWADYPEEDIQEINKDELCSALKNAAADCRELIRNYDSGQFIKNGLNTVIVGKPNVGKSTLMNLLTGFEKSIVTDIPGTTRDVVEETVTIGNIVLNLSDTAGIRESDDVVEKIGVDRAIGSIKKAHMAIAVFDSSKEIDNEDKKILDEIKELPSIIVINKTDLDSRLDTDIFSSFENVVYMSAKTEEGVQDLIKTVESIAGTENFDENSALIYNERQRSLVNQAISDIDEAISAIENNMTYDAVTISIESAIEKLLELTGERVTEAVVDKVFHNFCVGK